MDSKENYYEQIAKHHRHFLLWRQYLLAGYFIIFSTLTIASINLEGEKKIIIPWIFVLMVLLSFIFIGLEKRNIELYTICQRLGAKFEKDSKIPGMFSYFEIQKEVGKPFFSHTDIIMALYFSGSFISMLASIYFFIDAKSKCGFYFISILVILITFVYFLRLKSTSDSILFKILDDKIDAEFKK